MPLELKNMGERATLIVNGVIGTEITSAEFQMALNGLDDDVAEVEVVITSVGGIVREGHAMFGMLRESGKRIITTIVGGAYSAAAVLALAGDERRMHSNALLMYHGASSGGASTVSEHLEAADVLQKVNELIADTIAERTHMNREGAAEMLNRDTYLTAREAKLQGFIDTIISDNEPANTAFVELVPADIRNELGVVASSNPEPKEPEMAEATNEPVAATSKEIKAVCEGADPAFVLEQIENESTIEQVKDAWLAKLAQDKAITDARNAELAAELEQAKKIEPENAGGVDPVSANSADGDDASDDPIASFDEALARHSKNGKVTQRAMSAAIAEDPERHKAYLDAYNAAHRSV